MRCLTWTHFGLCFLWQGLCFLSHQRLTIPCDAKKAWRLSSGVFVWHAGPLIALEHKLLNSLDIFTECTPADAVFCFPQSISRNCLQEGTRQGPFFRKKWKEGSWGPMHLCKGDKSKLLLQREQHIGGPLYTRKEMLREKSLWCICLLSGSLINGTFRKFKVSVILSTVNFIFLPPAFISEWKGKDKDLGIHPSSAGTKLVTSFVTCKSLLN